MVAMAKDAEKLTVRVSRENLAFIVAYAREHGVTFDEVITRSLVQFRYSQDPCDDLTAAEISGVLKGVVSDRKAYFEHMDKKHR